MSHRYIEGGLQLQITREKSKVGRVSNCVCLGYVIGAEGEMEVAEKSVEKLEKEVRGIIRRGRALELQAVIGGINLAIPGWVNYYKLVGIKKTMWGHERMDEAANTLHEEHEGERKMDKRGKEMVAHVLHEAGAQR